MAMLSQALDSKELQDPESSIRSARRSDGGGIEQAKLKQPAGLSVEYKVH